MANGPLNETRNDPEVVPGLAVTVAKSPTLVKACSCVCTSDATSLYGMAAVVWPWNVSWNVPVVVVVSAATTKAPALKVTMPAAVLNERMYDPEVVPGESVTLIKPLPFTPAG